MRSSYAAPDPTVSSTCINYNFIKPENVIFSIACVNLLKYSLWSKIKLVFVKISCGFENEVYFLFMTYTILYKNSIFMQHSSNLGLGLRRWKRFRVEFRSRVDRMQWPYNDVMRRRSYERWYWCPRAEKEMVSDTAHWIREAKKRKQAGSRGRANKEMFWHKGVWVTLKHKMLQERNDITTELINEKETELGELENSQPTHIMKNEKVVSREH